MSAAYMGFKMARSPKAWGIVWVRRRSSPNRRSSRLVVRQRQIQMRDAGSEVIEEALDRRAGRGVGRERLRLELTPAVGRHLDLQIAHTVRETPLAQTLRPTVFECPDESWRPIGSAEHPIVETARFEIAEKRPTTLGVFLAP